MPAEAKGVQLLQRPEAMPTVAPIPFTDSALIVEPKHDDEDGNELAPLIATSTEDVLNLNTVADYSFFSTVASNKDFFSRHEILLDYLPF